MKDKIYRETINPKTGKKILEPLSVMDIIHIASEIEKSGYEKGSYIAIEDDEIKKYIKSSERSGST